MNYYITFLLLTVYASLPAQPLAQRVIRADSMIQAFLSENNIPGMATAVSIDGLTVLASGAGYADLEHQVPVDPHLTKFRIGSISKALTAAAMARLYQAGQIELDIPIQQYVSSFPSHNNKDQVTFRNLAGHLAGIRHYRDNEFMINKQYNDVSSSLVIFIEDPLIHPPNTKYAYSSYGWNLLSAGLESAADKPFLELMQDSVFNPLGMINTQAELINTIIPHRTSYYVTDAFGKYFNAPEVNNSYKWAGGGFISTVTDLLLFANGIQSENFIKPEILKMFYTSQQDGHGVLTNYGLGFRSGIDDKGRFYFGHSGGSVGGTCNLIIYPKEQVVVALVTNRSSVRMGNINQKIASIFMD